MKSYLLIGLLSLVLVGCTDLSSKSRVDKTNPAAVKTSEGEPIPQKTNDVSESDERPDLLKVRLLGSFRSTNEIDAFLQRVGLPNEQQEVQGKEQKLYFVLAWPYSGMDNTDLYCYCQARNGSWHQFLSTVLPHTPPSMNIEFKVDDEFVDVVCGGRIVLKLNPVRL